MSFADYGLGIRSELIAIWDAAYGAPTPVQHLCLSAPRLLAGDSHIIVAPTSSGKTLIGEILSVRAASRMQRAIYVVPYKAIVHEKFLDFRARYGGIGLSIVAASGDYDEFDEDILRGNFDICVVVIEKLIQLLTQNPAILQNCGVIVVDEVQLVRDQSRGPGLEMLLTWIRRQASQPQIVCLSATVSDLNRFDEWLGCARMEHSDRPIPLEMTVATDEPAALVLDQLATGKQVLFFESTVARTQTSAAALAVQRPAAELPEAFRERLEGLEDSPTRDALLEMMPRGVGFHSTALAAEERRLVEDAFRAGHLRCLVSTSTLAMGVNLPADSVVVASPTRWMNGAYQPIEIGEWLNCAGRAGRLGLGQAGRAFLCCTAEARPYVEDRFLAGEPEPLDSAIPMSRSIAVHVLRAIAAGLAQSEQQAVELLQASYAALIFYGPNGQLAELERAVRESATALVEGGLVTRDASATLRVTSLGLTVAGSGIDIDTALKFVQYLNEDDDPARESGLLMVLADADEFADQRPYTTRFEDSAVTWSSEASSTWPDLNQSAPACLQAATLQRTCKRALMLHAWIEGRTLQWIEDKFGVSHGHARAAGETASWLCHGFAALYNAIYPDDTDKTRALHDLAQELHFGLRSPATEFLQLRVPGIRRNDAYRLAFNDKRPFISLSDALDADLEEFRGVVSPAMAQALQGAILEHIEESFARRIKGLLHRAADASISAVATEALARYCAAIGEALESELADLLRLPGIALDAQRIGDQPSGECDVIIRGPRGQIVVSCTANENKPVTWEKARAVVSSTGVSDVQAYVVVGRPEFHPEAISSALRLPEEQRLILVTVDVLGEACLRVLTGKLTADQLLLSIEAHRGLFTISDLPG